MCPLVLFENPGMELDTGSHQSGQDLSGGLPSM